MNRLDHIGYAVQNLDEAIRFYEKTFGYRVSHRESLSSQQVELAFLDLDNTKIELLSPLSEESTLTRFLATRGEGMHHVCYEVQDIKASLKELEGKGITLIDREPRPGAHHTLIAFLHPKSTYGVLTELCQYQR